MSLVSLYRKSEPYPGPLVERTNAEEQQNQRASSSSSHAKKKRRGHRRNASEYLPDSAHYRAGYSYQDSRQGSGGEANNRFRDMAPRNYGGGGNAAAAVVPPSAGGTSGGAASAASASTGASGPPRYSSNPSLDVSNAGGGASAPSVPTEYERPPPYYFPGSAPPATGDAPPPLPAPNASRA